MPQTRQDRLDQRAVSHFENDSGRNFVAALKDGAELTGKYEDSVKGVSSKALTSVADKQSNSYDPKNPEYDPSKPYDDPGKPYYGFQHYQDKHVLLVALRENKIDIAEQLIKHPKALEAKGGSLDTTDPRRSQKGVAAVHLAVEKKQPRLLKLLKENGADIHAVNGKGLNAADIAAVLPENTEEQKKDKKEVLEALAKMQVLPLNNYMEYHNFVQNLQKAGTHTSLTTYSPEDYQLLQAVRYKSPYLLRGALENGANPNLRDFQGVPVLSLAVKGNNPEIVGALLNRPNINLDAKDADNRRPLHYAAQYASAEIIQNLRYVGANPDKRDKQDNRPLHVAAEHAKTKEGVERISALTATLKKPDPNKEGADITYKSADVNAKNKAGEAPIHVAIREGNALAVEACGRKCDINQKFGKDTPLDLAIQYQKDHAVQGEMVSTIVNVDNSSVTSSIKVSKPVSASRGGGTLVHQAVRDGNIELAVGLSKIREKDKRKAKYSIDPLALDVNGKYGLELALERALELGEAELIQKIYNDMARPNDLFKKRGELLEASKSEEPSLGSKMMEAYIISGHQSMVDALGGLGGGRTVKLHTPPKNKNAVDRAAHSALDEALNAAGDEKKKARKYLDIILTAGVDVNAVDEQGETLYQKAQKAVGDQKDVIEVLEKHNAKDGHGKTALLNAIESGNDNKIKALLARDADVNTPDNDGNLPLMAAVTALDGGKKGKIIERLLEFNQEAGGTNKVNIDAQKASDGNTALHLAIQTGDLSVISQLEAAGADFSIENNAGKSALALANESAKEGVKAHVEELLHAREQRQALEALTKAIIEVDKAGVEAQLAVIDEKGFDINAHVDVQNPSEQPISPIAALSLYNPPAAGETRTEEIIHTDKDAIADLLIDAGADINAKNEHGRSVFELACDPRLRKGDLMHVSDNTIAYLLEKEDLEIDVKDRLFEGKTAKSKLLSQLAEFASEETLKKVADKAEGLDLEKVTHADFSGNTPLHGAVKAGNKGAVSWLLEQGADPHAANNADQTPLDIAREGKNESIAAMLVDESKHGKAEPNKAGREQISANTTKRVFDQTVEIIASEAVKNDTQFKIPQRDGMPEVGTLMDVVNEKLKESFQDPDNTPYAEANKTKLLVKNETALRNSIANKAIAMAHELDGWAQEGKQVEDFSVYYEKGIAEAVGAYIEENKEKLPGVEAPALPATEVKVVDAAVAVVPPVVVNKKETVAVVVPEVVPPRTYKADAVVHILSQTTNLGENAEKRLKKQVVKRNLADWKSDVRLEDIAEVIKNPEVEICTKGNALPESKQVQGKKMVLKTIHAEHKDEETGVCNADAVLDILHRHTTTLAEPSQDDPNKTIAEQQLQRAVGHRAIKEWKQDVRRTDIEAVIQDERVKVKSDQKVPEGVKKQALLNLTDKKAMQKTQVELLDERGNDKSKGVGYTV